MKRRAQAALEYAVLLAVIVAGLIAMSFYIRRSLSGRLRDNAGQLSEGMFYSPGATTAHFAAATFVIEASDSRNIINTVTNETTSDTVNRSIVETAVLTENSESLLPLNEEPKR
ncbi:MAG: hypothetical protein Q8N85_05310 [Candidatus Omnitrophota bacterium]|nr:hypothetical protein [Candidatus Omnitrophota bacterium]